MVTVMAKKSINIVACHNCRRQRLKCDQTLPGCLKCIKRGQECLGYQKLFRWESGMASRGKLAGVTSQDLLCTRGKVSLPKCLADPLIQDLSGTSRRYLLYCKTSLPQLECLSLTCHAAQSLLTYARTSCCTTMQRTTLSELLYR
jgi:hypothetical protein